MKHFAVLLVSMSCTAFVPTVAANPDDLSNRPTTDINASTALALDILKKADKATRAVDTAQYDVSWKGTGWLDALSWTMRGQVISKKAADGNPPMFRFAVLSAFRPGSQDELKMTSGSDGTTFYLVDAQSMKVHVGSDRTALGRAGRNATRLPMLEFAHATPFTDEINGDKTLLLGTGTVDGIECHHVYVMYKGGRQEAEWYFSKSDFLPRRVDRIFRTRQGEKAARIRTVTNLVVNSQLPDAAFAPKIPEGYVETSDPAPDPRIPF